MRALPNKALQRLSPFLAALWRALTAERQFVGQTTNVASVFLVMLSVAACKRDLPQRNHGLAATEGDHLQVAGSETWSIGGKAVPVLGTYYMVLESGVEYVIESPREPSPAALELDAWPVIRHAFENRKYLRSRVTRTVSVTWRRAVFASGWP